MSSTNKTPNLQLSQWIATDKPTFLGDMNADNLKIDSAVASRDGQVNSLSTRVDATETAITQHSDDLLDMSETVSTALSNSQTALGTANSAANVATTADGKATTATNTANTAKNTADSASAAANTATTNIGALTPRVTSLENLVNANPVQVDISQGNYDTKLVYDGVADYCTIRTFAKTATNIAAGASITTGNVPAAQRPTIKIQQLVNAGVWGALFLEIDTNGTVTLRNAGTSAVGVDAANAYIFGYYDINGV